MRISILTIGAVASIIAINSVSADTTSTVTSRGYVDAVVATKQPKIPAAGTNAATPGETVVTYTSTGDGTIGERGIFNPQADFDWDNNEVATGHEGDLVTADIYQQVGYLYNNMNNPLPTMAVTKKTCYAWSGKTHTDENCLLWNLTDKYVYGCDCSCGDVNAEGHATCNSDGTCNYDGCVLK